MNEDLNNNIAESMLNSGEWLYKPIFYDHWTPVKDNLTKHNILTRRVKTKSFGEMDIEFKFVGKDELNIKFEKDYKDIFKTDVVSRFIEQHYDDKQIDVLFYLWLRAHNKSNIEKLKESNLNPDNYAIFVYNDEEIKFYRYQYTAFSYTGHSFHIRSKNENTREYAYIKNRFNDEIVCFSESLSNIYFMFHLKILEKYSDE